MIPRSDVSVVEVEHSHVRFCPLVRILSFHQDHLGAKAGQVTKANLKELPLHLERVEVELAKDGR